MAAEDGEALLEFFRSSSQESRQARFFGSVADHALRQIAEQQVGIGPGRRCSSVAKLEPDDSIVGHATCSVDGTGRAEIASCAPTRASPKGWRSPPSLTRPH